MGLNPAALYQAVLRDVGHFLPDGSPSADWPPDSSVETVFSVKLLNSLLKKWEVRGAFADERALLKFLTADNRCEKWELRLSSTVDEMLWMNLKQEIDNFFYKRGELLFSSYFDFWSKAVMGPGSAVGSRGQSLYAKLFASELHTTNEELYHSYSSWVKWYPEWNSGEILRTIHYGAPLLVNGSRMTFVPKTSDVSRLICVEPSLNIYAQQGLAAILNSRLFELYRHDPARQPDYNREFAWMMSLGGEFCTLDLESASDSMSVFFLMDVLPPYVFQTLMELRSPNVLIPGIGWRQLSMISTMGNGFTFALQTIIFSCIVRAAYRVYNVEIRDNTRYGPGNWGVFGDDIVIERRAVRGVLRLLELSNFLVNHSKSFYEGPFGESCGCDFFRGHNVRGVYIKSLSSQQDITVAINLLNEWSARSGIYLPESIRLLFGSLRDPYFVPYQENMDSGIRVPFEFFDSESPARGKYAYRRYEPRRKVVRILDGITKVPRGCKKLIYNPYGLMISFLRGELRNGTIAVRHDRSMYRTKLACVPWWDYMPVELVQFGSCTSWRRWKSATLNNLKPVI
jgi:hypothetical protein